MDRFLINFNDWKHFTSSNTRVKSYSDKSSTSISFFNPTYSKMRDHEKVKVKGFLTVLVWNNEDGNKTTADSIDVVVNGLFYEITSQQEEHIIVGFSTENYSNQHFLLVLNSFHIDKDETTIPSLQTLIWKSPVKSGQATELKCGNFITKVPTSLMLQATLDPRNKEFTDMISLAVVLNYIQTGSVCLVYSLPIYALMQISTQNLIGMSWLNPKVVDAIYFKLRNNPFQERMIMQIYLSDFKNFKENLPLKLLMKNRMEEKGLTEMYTHMFSNNRDTSDFF